MHRDWSPMKSPSGGRLDMQYEERLFSPTKSQHTRCHTPPSTPPSQRSLGSADKRQRRSSRRSVLYSDRFIPNRSASRLDFGFSALGDFGSKGENQNNRDSQSNVTEAKEGNSTYNLLLQSEILGLDAASVRSDASDRKTSDGGRQRNQEGRMPCSPISMLRYKAAKSTSNNDNFRAAFSLSPLSSASRRLMSRPVKAKRKIAKVPFKVLDAPALQDDFYLNLVDWSSLNVLAVGLGSCVYLWSACTSKVTKLCDLGPEDLITSVSWSQRGHQMSVGTNKGEVQLWDTVACKHVRSMGGHSARVGTMAWNAHVLATGSRDRHIFQRDMRVAQPTIRKLSGHKQEVCGLKWSFDDQQLASGGNDNKLFIWDASTTTPLARFNEHTAAVKAIAWSPHQHGLLASGGGTADRRIRFWNTLTGTALSCVDTDSQVCNLTWSKNVNEIVSTHGYSLNQIIVWRYPSMTKVATLTGHTYRVLYLAMSPDGQTIVTGAGDETLRFWNVFPGPKNKDGSRLGTSLLFPTGADIR